MVKMELERLQFQDNCSLKTTSSEQNDKCHTKCCHDSHKIKVCEINRDIKHHRDKLKGYTCACCIHKKCFQTASTATRKMHLYNVTKSNRILLLYLSIVLIFNPIVLCMSSSTSDTSLVAVASSTSNSIDIARLDSDKSENNFDTSVANDDSDDDDDVPMENESTLKEIEEQYKKQFQKQQTYNNKFTSDVDRQKQHKPVATKAPQKFLFKPQTCSSSCMARKTLQEASLWSIRNHVLLKLGMQQEPNITINNLRDKYSPTMLEMICKKVMKNPDDCIQTIPNNPEYQSEDASIVDNNEDFIDDSDYKRFEDSADVENEIEDIQYMSTEKRIYAFPNETLKTRHRQHLYFQFLENQETNNLVAQATLYLYVHSEKWWRSSKHSPKNIRKIDIEISKVLNGPYKEIVEVFRNITIPDINDSGHYIQLNITNMVAEWFANHNMTHGMAVKVTTSNGTISSHSLQKIVSLDPSSQTKPFIEIFPKDQRKKRSKRSSLKCSRDSNEQRCCRRPLTVDFEKFGWDWIIAPKKYDAYYCAGECKIAFLQKYAHTHVWQMSTSANPCCSPRKLSPMQLLYFDTHFNIVLVTVPNMIVEECFCS